MHRIHVAHITAAVLVAASFALPSTAAHAADKPSPKPLAKNVIVLVDDGAGYAQHEAGSLYDTGLPTGEAYDEFPFRFGVTTYSYGDVPQGACGELTGYDPALAWTEWDYVMQDPTDSAAAATAMATGTKTYDSAIGVNCSGEEETNVTELAEGLGKSTGVVTSVPLSHATPAAFVAHNVARDVEPTLADQMIRESATDVIMGAGHPGFNRQGLPIPNPVNWGYAFIDKPTWDDLVAGVAGGDADGDGDPDPWTLLQDRSAFQALEAGDTPARVLGMAKIRRTLQQERVPSQATADPYKVPFLQSVPTLEEMTNGALNVLDNNEKGFFLMVEGGATDWAAHDNQKGRLIEEEIAFDRSVDAVLRWVDQNSNWGETLVVVTSDHETGYLTGPGSGPSEFGPVWTPLVGNGQGGVPGMQYNSGTHTNSLVPVYAKGDAGRMLRQYVDGADPVHGLYVDNTDLHRLFLDALQPPSR